MNDSTPCESRRTVLKIAAAAAALAVMPRYLQAATSASGGVPMSDAALYGLLYGLGFRASGGGGGYEIGLALIEAIIRDIPVQNRVLYDIMGAADSDVAIMAGGIGAPSAITPDSILDFVDYAHIAITTYSTDKGVAINALVPVEAGPVNALLAMYLGWKYQYKVFDCDGAGRAVPSLTNLVFGYNNYPIAPVYLAGSVNGTVKATEITPPPQDAAAAEAAIRDNLGQYGDAAGLICWAQTGRELRDSTAVLPGTLSALIAFGNEAAATGFTQSGLVSFLNGRPEVTAVYTGTVTDIEAGSQPGYDDGFVVVSSDTGEPYRIHSLNENMILYDGIGNALATAPSAIAMMFDIDSLDFYELLNNGDDLKNAGVIGRRIIFCVMNQACLLFRSDIVESFATVLRNPPFSYDGAILPQSCS